MDYHNLYLLGEAQERLKAQFKEAPPESSPVEPLRSPATSMMAAYAAWVAHALHIMSAFWRIKHRAQHVKTADYEWVHKVVAGARADTR
jgi:hypothetical protein